LSTGGDRRSEYVAGEREQPSCEKEKAEFDFSGNDLSADRGFASTSQQQNSNKA